MSLETVITSSHKEIAGSRSKNRLTVQISYAIQLIMEFYSTDFLVMMDYIEDVSVIQDPINPSKIYLYQVKTKSSDKQYSLATVIKDEWFQKLYNNALKYQGYVASAAVVCNTDVVNSGSEVFPNRKTSLDEVSIQNNVKKIRSAIAKNQGLQEEEVQLSKYYFIRSTLSTKSHKEEVEYEFENFLLKQDPDLQVATAKSVYKLLYDQLDEKFNNEINEDCTDIEEIYSEKGINSQSIKDLIACGLAIQIPSLDKLLFEYSITAVSEKRKYVSQYTQIKMDMYSNISLFIEMKKNLLMYIEVINQEGVEDMLGIMSEVYEMACSSCVIPESYSEEYYLKLLIMILIYRYCYGGELQ